MKIQILLHGILIGDSTPSLSTFCAARSKPIGEIVDYFWRVEFQHRGSPHIHALLWIKDAPDVLQLSESEIGRIQLASYVENAISVLSKSLQELNKCKCSTCTSESCLSLDILSARPPNAGSAEWECDLSRVVHRVQKHICCSGSSCRKRGDSCRFGYPKEIVDRTKVVVGRTDDGTSSLQIQLKREDPTINNYSPVLLSSWRANMDIQLIGNAYGAAEYTGAYVSKAEPDTLRFRKVIARAVKLSDPNLPNIAILKRVANATLSIREVSAHEAYYILLRELPLYGKSRQVTRVKVMRHNARYYRVDASDLRNLERIANRADEIRIEPVEKAYMGRPKEPPVEDMTLTTFVEQYELVDSVSKMKLETDYWRIADNGGYIKRRNKPQVVRSTPWMTPDATNPDFCFAEIFLHVPWRSLKELPDTDGECTERFEREQESALRNELQEESGLKLTRQRELDAQKTSRQPLVCTASI